MKRYSKKLNNLLEHKKSFFEANEESLAEIKRVCSVYVKQALRTRCKNCNESFVGQEDSFSKGGVVYRVCATCGHLNGANEDSDNFCRFLYTDEAGEAYAQNYLEHSRERYKSRTAEIYVPKAEFLRDALREEGEAPESIGLVDVGAGAGYFLAAASQCGFGNVGGFEASESLVALGNRFLEGVELVPLDLKGTSDILGRTDSEVVSMIGVLEHLQFPREALGAIAANPAVRYLFVSLPLLSPTVAFEAVFDDVMPRHLSAGHTHLYTETSIRHFCSEFGFRRASEWWFGLDVADLFRSLVVSLRGRQGAGNYLETYWRETMFPVLDELQSVLDRGEVCSEVHLLLAKTNIGRPGE